MTRLWHWFLQGVRRYCNNRLNDYTYIQWFEWLDLPTEEVAKHAENLVIHYSAPDFESRSAEYKRDRCYKTLCRAYPTFSRSAIGLAIEIGYQKVTRHGD